MINTANSIGGELYFFKIVALCFVFLFFCSLLSVSASNEYNFPDFIFILLSRARR